MVGVVDADSCHNQFKTACIDNGILSCLPVKCSIGKDSENIPMKPRMMKILLHGFTNQLHQIIGKNELQLFTTIVFRNAAQDVATMTLDLCMSKIFLQDSLKLSNAIGIHEYLDISAVRTQASQFAIALLLQRLAGDAPSLPPG